MIVNQYNRQTFIRQNTSIWGWDRHVVIDESLTELTFIEFDIRSNSEVIK